MPSLPRGPLGPSTPLPDLYESRYLPARHPDPKKKSTREQYRTAIRNFSKPRQFEDWLRVKTAASKAEKSRAQLYREFDRALRKGYLPTWQATVADLTDANVEAAMHFIVEVANEKTTANKLRRHINALWRFAEEIGLVTSLPKNKRYKVPKKIPIALLPDELDRLIAAAEAMPGMVGAVPAREWYPAAVLFIYSLGVRIGAAVQVPTANVDFSRGDVLVPHEAQKQAEDQRLDLFESVLVRLKRLRLVERGVPTVLGDWPYQVQALRNAFKRLLVKAEIFACVDDVPREFCFHILRRTLASQIKASYGIDAARERLGHSSLQVTEAYIDPRYSAQPKVREMLPDPRPIIPLDDPPPQPPVPTLRLYRGEAG